MLLKPFGKLLVRGPLDQGTNRDIAKFALGLALELWILQTHTDDGGETLADVFALETVVLAIFQDVLLECVLVHDIGE